MSKFSKPLKHKNKYHGKRDSLRVSFKGLNCAGDHTLSFFLIFFSAYHSCTGVIMSLMTRLFYMNTSILKRLFYVRSSRLMLSVKNSRIPFPTAAFSYHCLILFPKLPSPWSLFLPLPFAVILFPTTASTGVPFLNTAFATIPFPTAAWSLVLPLVFAVIPFPTTALPLPESLWSLFLPLCNAQACHLYDRNIRAECVCIIF